jgi:hypothetical protein
MKDVYANGNNQFMDIDSNTSEKQPQDRLSSPDQSLSETYSCSTFNNTTIPDTQLAPALSYTGVNRNSVATKNFDNA